MHPHAVDPELDALAHPSICLVDGSPDDNAVDAEKYAGGVKRFSMLRWATFGNLVEPANGKRMASRSETLCLVRKVQTVSELSARREGWTQMGP